MLFNKSTFATVTAIVVASFTIFASNESRWLVSKANSTDCFLPSATTTGKLLTFALCPGSPGTIPVISSLCTQAKANFAPIGSLVFKLFSLDQFGAILISQQSVTCPDSDGQFCCFNIVIDPSPCATQPLIRVGLTNEKWKISSVRCKFQ